MDANDSMRLDKWLWCARLTESRAAAQKLCQSRHLRMDGRIIQKSGALVRCGAQISFPQGNHVIAVRVEALSSKRLGPGLARNLYTALFAAPNAHLSNHPGWAPYGGQAPSTGD